jgi:hypothetical protein
MTLFQILNSKVHTWKNIIHVVTAGIDRYWPVLTGIWPVLTGIWPGTRLGLFYTGLGTGTRHSSHSGRYRNEIHHERPKHPYPRMQPLGYFCIQRSRLVTYANQTRGPSRMRRSWLPAHAGNQSRPKRPPVSCVFNLTSPNIESNAWCAMRTYFWTVTKKTNKQCDTQRLWTTPNSLKQQTAQ